MKQNLAVLLLVAGYCLALPILATAQRQEVAAKTVTLVARRQTEQKDNYTSAAFNFKYGVNGDESTALTLNNWDVLFGNQPDADTFEVTMVVDDCSRIKDLGWAKWSDEFEVPTLRAYPVPTRETPVPALLGHIYLVHTKDRDNDHYALFRVEELQPLQSVTISWKLIPAPVPRLEGSFGSAGVWPANERATRTKDSQY